ncbi:MAG: hypothetical protein WCS89_01160 [Candidatus Paceibacterota bacterium]
MDKSPNKEAIAFFTECIGMGGVLMLIVGFFLLRILETFGIVKVNLWN